MSAQNITTHRGQQFLTESFITNSHTFNREERAPTAPVQRTVLIIDDDTELRSLLAFVFSQKGYAVVEAEDGEQGLKATLTKNFDLVLVDFDLPFIHGLEVVRELRQHPKFEALPIIMMTSHGNRVREKAVKAGCDQFLPKPLDFDRLYEMLEYFAPVTTTSHS